MSSLPGYFVGFGLLFTFVGLLAALFFASETVSSSDIKVAQRGLQDLLSAATFKFWTSVAGLFCSMLLSFFFRIYDRVIDGACQNLCRAIEDKLQYVSVQDLGNKMERTLRQQLDETKKINTEVAFTIGKSVSDALENKLPAALKTTMEPLVKQIQETSERMSSMGETGIGEMAKQFTENLQSSAGEEMKQLSATLSTMQTTLGDLRDSIGEITKGFADSASQSRGELETTLKEFRDTLSLASDKLGTDLTGAAANAANVIEEGIEGLIVGLRNEIQGLTASLSAMEQTFQGQASALTGAADQSNKAADAFGRVANDLRSASAPISQSTQQLAAAGERITDAVEAAASSFASSQNEAEKLSTRINDGLTEMSALWESYRSRFEKVDEDMERAFDKMSDKIRANQEGLTGFITGIDQSFDKALGVLSQTIGQLQETNEELAEALSEKRS